jgi:hypothetical protein
MNEIAAVHSIYRRVIVRIIPFVFICYLVAMIDRLNVSFAKLQFMSELHLSGGVVSPIYIGWMKDLTGSFYGALGSLGLLLMLGWSCFTPAFAMPRRHILWRPYEYKALSVGTKRWPERWYLRPPTSLRTRLKCFCLALLDRYCRLKVEIWINTSFEVG